MGVHVPNVNTVEDARKAAALCRYAPLGNRGLAGVRAANYGLREKLNDYCRMANEEVMVIAHIEDIEAIHNLDQLLTVDGIDVYYLGPVDLSNSMGKPGVVDAEAEKDRGRCHYDDRGRGKSGGNDYHRPRRRSPVHRHGGALSGHPCHSFHGCRIAVVPESRQGVALVPEKPVVLVTERIADVGLQLLDESCEVCAPWRQNRTHTKKNWALRMP